MSMNNLVTGASGGMGFTTCQKLVASGYTVYGLPRQEHDGLFSFRFLRADITDSSPLELLSSVSRKRPNLLQQFSTLQECMT
ncbi:MAG: NAD-dependent epimerase/dehydratase family protein [Sphaerochaeta sp.]|uniref:NAD-dependent epimerase/dehydratase family protein n=1 Tax=Sphaerochaeta sp. TaxID=1972642 RepID=UPI003D14968C